MMMSVGSGGGAAHQLFLSTHNALNFREEDEDKLRLVVQELDQELRQARFTVFPFQNVEMVKRLIIKKCSLPGATNITELRVFFGGAELPNHRTLATLSESASQPRGGGAPQLRLFWSFRLGSTRHLREVGMRAPPRVAAIMAEVELAFQRGVHPKLAMDGTGGTYFLDDCGGAHIAMFKAADEEPFAPRNPRGYPGKMGQRGFRHGVLSGEGAQRELAAFLLDAQYGGFARVPQTTKVEMRHSALNYLPGEETHFKEGSLQEYVADAEMCGDYDSALFAVGDVHRIAIFDMIVLNMDRNDCNILVVPRDLAATTNSTNNNHHGNSSSSGSSCGDITPGGKLSRFTLVPIDHGLILPDTMDVGDCDLVWFYWPQSKVPFSAAELRHVYSLDAAKDARRLSRKLGIRADCLRTLRVSTLVLQLAVSMHLNAFQTAGLMCRVGDLELPSVMETAVQFALAQSYTALAATGLQHTTRLPGRVVTDLHVASGAASGGASGGGQPAESSDEEEEDEEEEDLVAKKGGITTDSSDENSSDEDSSDENSSDENSSDEKDEEDEEGEDEEESSSEEGEEGDVVSFHGPVSRLSGVPLLPCGSQVDIWRQLKRRRRRKLRERARRLRLEAKGGHHNHREETAGEEPRSTGGNRTTGTFRRTTNMLALRGTAARGNAHPQGSWTLLQSSIKAPLDWSDPVVDRAFFAALRAIVRQKIVELHPQWQSYPYNGSSSSCPSEGKKD